MYCEENLSLSTKILISRYFILRSKQEQGTYMERILCHLSHSLDILTISSDL